MVDAWCHVALYKVSRDLAHQLKALNWPTIPQVELQYDVGPVFPDLGEEGDEEALAGIQKRLGAL